MTDGTLAALHYGYQSNSLAVELEFGEMIAHGDGDRIIKPAHARANHAASGNSRLLWYPMGHNDPPPRVFWDDVESFLIDARIIDYNSGAVPPETPLPQSEGS